MTTPKTIQVTAIDFQARSIWLDGIRVPFGKARRMGIDPEATEVGEFVTIL